MTGTQYFRVEVKRAHWVSACNYCPVKAEEQKHNDMIQIVFEHFGGHIPYARPTFRLSWCLQVMRRLFVPPVFRLGSEINGRTERENKLRSTFNQCTWNTVAFVVLNSRSSKQKYIRRALSLRPALCTMQINIQYKITLNFFYSRHSVAFVSLTHTTNKLSQN